MCFYHCIYHFNSVCAHRVHFPPVTTLNLLSYLRSPFRFGPQIPSFLTYIGTPFQYAFLLSSIQSTFPPLYRIIHILNNDFNNLILTTNKTNSSTCHPTSLFTFIAEFSILAVFDFSAPPLIFFSVLTVLGFCSHWKIEIRKISGTSLLLNLVLYLNRSTRNYWLLQIILLLGFWNNIASWFSSCLTGYSCLISSAVLPHLPNLSILDVLEITLLSSSLLYWYSFLRGYHSVSRLYVPSLY